MKITSINYQKTFNLGNYCSERVGVEMETNSPKDAIEALDEAKKFVEDWHKANNPQLFVDEASPIKLKVEVTKPINIYRQNDEETISHINSCTQKTVLESYHIIVRNNPKLKEAYDQQMEKLTDTAFVHQTFGR